VSAGRRVRLAAYAICIDDASRILLVRVARSLTENEMWMLPGGGLEFGEDPASGVLRELEEETGLTGRVDSLLGAISTTFEAPTWADGDDVHNVSLIYLVSGTTGMLRDEVDGSTEACAWVSIDEAELLELWDVAREGLRLAREQVPA
jgi:8-oxo-dGTP pyrophosphatase MutT (NUDIX family)